MEDNIFPLQGMWHMSKLSNMVWKNHDTCPYIPVRYEMIMAYALICQYDMK